MFNKTSSIDFLKYGEVFNSDNSSQINNPNNHKITVQSNSFSYLYQANNDIYLKCLEGICMLVICKDFNMDSYEEFVIHRVIKINKGTLFNFVALGSTAKLEIAFQDDTVMQTKFSQNTYHYKRMTRSLHINELIAYYYNIRSANYYFPGETDNHWEITIVDTGKLHTTIDNVEYTLSNSQLIFYAPGQYHKQMTRNETCSYLTIIFDMDIPERYKERLTNKVFDLNSVTKESIDIFIRSNDFNHAYDADMMMVSIEKIIIDLLRTTSNSHKKSSGTPMQQKFESELLNEILLYINENTYSPFNVEELCSTFAISRSSLQSLFRKYLHIAPKEYISNIKLEKSKLLLRESKYTISEIANILGFSSIHYFSRLFKQEYGVTPSEYSKKIF